MKLNPLAAVLVGQVVVLIGALGFFAGRSGHSAPAPVAKKKSQPPRAVAEVEEVELHPLKPVAAAEPAPAAEVHPPPAKLSDEKETEEPAEWKSFEAKPEPVAEAPKSVEQKREAPAAPSSFEDVVSSLVAGNARFVEGATKQRDLVAIRESLASEERASAIVVTCTDSRVVPELLFDQPLGTFDVLRVPGAQVDELAAKAVDEAIARLHAKAVLVLGHVGCAHVDKAMSRAGQKKSARPASLVAALGGLTTEEGDVAAVTFSAMQLQRRSKQLGPEVTLLRVLYTPKSGAVRWLDAEEPTPAPAPRSGRR